MKTKIKIIFSPKCLEYYFPGHPESPNRVKKSAEFLKRKKFEFEEPILASEKDILLAHSEYLLESVKEGAFFDPDTPNLPNIFFYALLSAGGAIKAAKVTLENQKECIGFSLMRPPGHHATKNQLGGFCYFNNIAIAVKKIIKENNIKRVGIIDIDCHHGQGTQDIFGGDKNVFYFSLHQKEIYPGTGLESKENILNIPLVAGISDKEYLSYFKKGIEKVMEFNPEIIGVSAGFDTYKKDPLTAINLELSIYRKIGKIIKKTGKPIFAVLEGGYSDDLPKCIYSFLRGIL